MKRFTEKDFENIENSVYSVGIQLSIITSLIKFLDVAMNNEFDITEADIANLTIILREKILDINNKYNNIECLLGI